MAEGPDEVRERVKRNENPTPEEVEELRRQAQSDDEVEAARANIELTRTEMTETVDAIQEKLGPQNVKEQVTAQAREVARGAGSELLEAVRNNPVPVAIGGMVVVGLVVLARGLQGGGRRGSTGGVVIDLRRGEVRGA